MVYINTTGKHNEVWLDKPYATITVECPECPSTEDAYSSGYTDGSEEGYHKGYPSGYTDGYGSGYTDGLSACSGGSCEEEWQDGYDSGYTDGSNSVDCTDFYNSGVTDGIAEQKAKMIPLSITENGTYTKEDGYSSVEVNVPQTGQTINNQTKLEEIDNTDTQLLYDSKRNYYYYAFKNNPWGSQTRTYTYDSGYTGLEKLNVNLILNASEAITLGENQQKAKLSAATFTQNGTYTIADGWSAVTVYVSGYTQQDLENAYNSGWTNGYDSGYTDGYESGHTPTPPTPPSSAETRLAIVFNVDTELPVYIMNGAGAANYFSKAELENGTSIDIKSQYFDGRYIFPTTGEQMVYYTMTGDTIPTRAFANNCTKADRAYIQSGVTTIGISAFEDCNNLTGVSLADTVLVLSAGTFKRCEKLTGIDLNNVTTIGDECFHRCYSLSSITIPSSVTSIGVEAFEYCSGLTEMNFDGTVPPTLGNEYSLGQHEYTFPIYVPCEAVDTYKTAWPYYAHRIMCNPNPDSGSTSDYLTLEIKSDGGVVHFNPHSTGSDGKSYDYRINQNNWVENLSGSCEFSVSSGDTVEFRGNDISLKNANLQAATFYGTTASFDVHGNIMSMYRKTNFENIVTIPVGHSFENFFKDCRGLVSAENLELPATTLQQFCYERMFENCVSLVTAPELPATTLASYCYQYMFNNCTSLTSAPELPALTLTQYCYYSMFNNCSSLEYVKCLATDISAEHSTTVWVDGVSSSGTFVKNSSMTGWSTGYDGIPTGWTVVDAS